MHRITRQTFPGKSFHDLVFISLWCCSSQITSSEWISSHHKKILKSRNQSLHLLDEEGLLLIELLIIRPVIVELAQETHQFLLVLE